MSARSCGASIEGAPSQSLEGQMIDAPDIA